MRQNDTNASPPCGLSIPISGASEGAPPVLSPQAFDGHFGFLHQPAGAHDARTTGVVLIPALGRDGRCAHAPSRQFADQLARLGYPVLRYEHLATGDSGEPDAAQCPAGGDLLPVWRGGVRQAAVHLKAQTGVDRVVLGGLRLGGSFAALAADDADGLMLMAPVLSGRAYLRRARFAATLARAFGPLDQLEPGGFDIAGLTLSPATTAALDLLDLTRLPAPHMPVFVAAQNRMVAEYGAALAAGGARVTEAPFAEFQDLYVDAHSNLAPDQMFAAAAGWLTDQFPTRAAPRDAVRPHAAEAPRLATPASFEQAVRFGPDLWGVVSLPRQSCRKDLAVIFLNTGGDPRAGIGGFAARAARRLARRGLASLRFDFSGLGDSLPPGCDRRPHVYATDRTAELDAALEHMLDQGFAQVVLVGVCSGAYHAARAAWRHDKVAGLFAASPVKLKWRKGDTLIFSRPTQIYKDGARSLDNWVRLLTGRIDLRQILPVLAHRARERAAVKLESLAKDAPLKEMRRFAARGGRALLLMGLEDASLDEVESHFGPRAARLRRHAGVQVEVVPGLDHGLTRDGPSRYAQDRLVAWLDQFPTPSPPQTPPPSEAGARRRPALARQARRPSAPVEQAARSRPG